MQYVEAFFLKIYCLPLSTQTTVEALDDEALFRIDEDEEEDGAFVMYVDIFALLSDLLLNYHCFTGATLPMHWATISWVSGS